MIHDHSECVGVALPRRVAVLQIEAGGVQQFRCRVSGGSNGERGRATGVDIARIRDDRDEPIVSEASVEVAVDDDVCLCGTVNEHRRKLLVARTGLRSLWIMSIECRYCNPLAASASFWGISGSGDRGKRR